MGGGIYHRFHRWLSIFNPFRGCRGVCMVFHHQFYRWLFGFNPPDGYRGGVVRMWVAFHHSTCRCYRDKVYNSHFGICRQFCVCSLLLPLASAGGLKKVPFRFPDFSHMLCVFVVSNAVKSIDVDRLEQMLLLFNSFGVVGILWRHLLPPVSPMVIHIQLLRSC